MTDETKKILKEVMKNEISPLLIGLRNDIAELTKVHNEGMSTPIAFQFTPEAIKEFKHHDGKTPKRGTDYFTDEDIKNFKDATTPRKGKDYFTAVEIQEFKASVTPKKGVDYSDGATPIKGTDYFTDADIKEFLSRATPIKGIHYRDGTDGTPGEKGADGTKITAEQIRSKLESLKGSARLSIKAIKGLEEKLADHFKEYSGSKSNNQGGGMGAGSDVGGATYLSAGTNVTITGTGTQANPYVISSSGGGGGSYTFSTGLTDTGSTITANLSTGISGGQSVIGGIAASESLTLSSTAHATKGTVIFGSLSEYDEVNDRFGMGNLAPAARLEVTTNGFATTPTNASGIILSNNTASTAGATRQFSPILSFRGSAYKTDATAASQTVDFRQYLSTASGTATVSGDIVWTASINGGAYVSVMGISSSGVLTLYQGLPRTLDINASSTSIVGQRLYNTSNASTSAHARYEITVGGASGGDPYTAYTINGVTVWSQGVDNDSNDSYKISESAGLGTNDRFILRTGGLASVRAGLATSKQVTLGGGLKDYRTSVGNITTGEDDLFTYTTEANIFGTDGDNIDGEYSGTTAANANNKTFKFYFAGTNILNSGALALNDKNWKFTFKIIRVSATVVRYSIKFDYEGNTATVLEVGELTGLTLSGTNILKITGEATATNDIVATMGTMVATPASI